MMIITQKNEEKAMHFATLGMMDYASFYATMTLIEEIKSLRGEISYKNSCNCSVQDVLFNTTVHDTEVIMNDAIDDYFDQKFKDL